MVHTEGPNCLGCDHKLMNAHSALGAWFYWVKAVHPDIHISCSYRNRQDQEVAFDSGKSRLHYPLSAHNHTVQNTDTPCSLALDIFRLMPNGIASWDKDWYAQVAHETKTSKFQIKWGGEWKHLGDLDHFQLVIHQSPETIVPA